MASQRWDEETISSEQSNPEDTCLELICGNTHIGYTDAARRIFLPAL